MISPDGKFVVFQSYSNYDGGSIYSGNLYLKNLATGELSLLSSTSDPTKGFPTNSSEQVFPGDSQTVLFQSVYQYGPPNTPLLSADIFETNIDTGARTEVIPGTDWSFADSASFTPDGVVYMTAGSGNEQIKSPSP